MASGPSQSASQTSQGSLVDRPVSPAPSDQRSIQTVSTITYQRQEKETQEQFNKRIEELCQTLWPPPHSLRHLFLASHTAACLPTKPIIRPIIPQLEVPLIQHLNGGGFNHITSVRLPASYSKEGRRDLIVRVPRAERSRPEHQAATLNFVRSRTSIPVPSIVAADFSCNNALEKPYVIQHRVPGRDLESM